jgi:predicted transcriptional regulator
MSDAKSSNASGLAARRFSGELESAVLATLWASDAPLNPGQVRDLLGDDLAYTTIMTTLVRLHEKGQVTRERNGRAFEYQPSVDVASVAADKMRHVMEGSGDREGVLARFIGGLDHEDGQLLKSLINGRRPRPKQ